MAEEPIDQIKENVSPEWRRFFAIHPVVKKWMPVVLISFLTSLLTIFIVGAFIWVNRGKIERILVADLQKQVPLATTAPDVGSDAPTPIEPKDLTVTEVVAKVNPSVVSIEVLQTSSATINPFGLPGFTIEQKPQTRVVGKGTGFFVTSDGYIVTNRHVVDFNNATFSITRPNGKKHTASLIAVDPVYDLAILKISGSGYPSISFGDSENLKLGEGVVAIGFALGQFENTISTGVVSGLSRSIVAGGLTGGGTAQLDDLIQTDAAINPGNSGGPLVNMKGEVVGVNVAVAQNGQGIGFAIPSSYVRQDVDSVKRNGTIIRPYVGVQYTQIDSNIQNRLALSVDHGIIIQRVLSDSPASVSGLTPGDIVLNIDGVKLDGNPSFASIIRGKSVGQTVTMQVLSQNNTYRMVKVKLVQAPIN